MPWKAGGAGGTGGAAGAEAAELNGGLYVWLLPGFPAGTFSLSAGDVGEE